MTLRVMLLAFCVTCVAGTIAGSPPCSEPPEALSRVAPEFPEIARQARVEGKIELQVEVDGTGTVHRASILSTNRPNLGFEANAIAAVEQWRFEPNERCEQRTTTLEFDFELVELVTERPFGITTRVCPVVMKRKSSRSRAQISGRLNERPHKETLLLLRVNETPWGQQLNLVAESRPSADGTFKFVGVDPGHYAVSTIEFDGDGWSSPVFEIDGDEHVIIEPRDETSATRVSYLRPE